MSREDDHVLRALEIKVEGQGRKRDQKGHGTSRLRSKA